MDPTGELRLRRAGAADSTRWTLRRDGRTVAAVDLPPGGRPVVVEPEEGPAWRVEAYGRGWRLVARELAGGLPLLWYSGRWVRSGGELVLAPARPLDVRSRKLRRLDWRVREPGSDAWLLDAQAQPGHDTTEVRVRRLTPHQDEGLELAARFLAVLALLGWRESAAQPRAGILDALP